MNIKKSELKDMIKELVEEALVQESEDQTWPKKAGGVSKPATLSTKKLSAAWKKTADQIQGDYLPLKSGASYIEEIFRNPEQYGVGEGTVISTDYTDWFAEEHAKEENAAFAGKNYRGFPDFDRSIDGALSPEDLKLYKKVAKESFLYVNQTNYEYMGLNFAKIESTSYDPKYNGSFASKISYFLESKEPEVIVIDEAKAEPAEIVPMWALIGHSNVHSRRSRGGDFPTKHENYTWMKNSNYGELDSMKDFKKSIIKTTNRIMEQSYREYMGASADNYKIYKDVEKFKADAKKAGFTPNEDALYD